MSKEKTFVEMTEQEKEEFRAKQKSDVESLEKEERNFKDFPYSEEELEEALENFKDPKLLQKIHAEISKRHIGDDEAKMTNFLVFVSSLLENHKRRQSNGITGDSSIGKNNLIEANLEHLPKDSFIYLSSATQSTLEDDIHDKRTIAFKEINFAREDGANKHLIEIFKQLTEGGTSALKKDARTGYKTSRHEQAEQKTVVYPTTETQRDDEGQTRIIFTGIKTEYHKIKQVNDNTLENISSPEKILEETSKEDSWIRKGLTYFYKKQPQIEVVIPYAKLLREKIKEQDIFDNSSPRSQRDIKRLLALTCATTYLFQLQRQKEEYHGKTFVISEPQDFIHTLQISQDFFNQTYTGLDKRLLEVFKIVEDSETEWVDRNFIEEKLDVSKNTVKGYCQTLSDEGLIEGIKGSALNEKNPIRQYDGNRIYYRTRQKGIKKPLIRCQVSELKKFLEERTENKFDTFGLVYEEKGIKNKGINSEKDTDTPKNQEKAVSGSKIDTFSLTPLDNSEKVTKPSNSDDLDIEIVKMNKSGVGE